jgi:hypothetical protein
MGNDMKNSGSIGVLAGLGKKEGKEGKKERILEGSQSKIKRSYELPEGTIRKLKELKLLNDDPNITYNELVDEAIQLLYESKKK